MLTFAQRLHQAATAHPDRPTQAELARRAGVKTSSMSEWWNDNVHTAHLKALPVIRLAQYLGVQPLWLLTGQGPRHPVAPPPEVRHVVRAPAAKAEAPHAVTAITNPTLRLAIAFDALPPVLAWSRPNGRKGTRQDVLLELLGIIQERWHTGPEVEAPARAPAPTETPAPDPKTRASPGHARSSAGSDEPPT